MPMLQPFEPVPLPYKQRMPPEHAERLGAANTEIQETRLDLRESYKSAPPAPGTRTAVALEAFDRNALLAEGVLSGVLWQHGYIPNGEPWRAHGKPPAPMPSDGTSLTPSRWLPPEHAEQLGAVVEWIRETEWELCRDAEGEPKSGSESASDSLEELRWKIAGVLDEHFYYEDGKPLKPRRR